MQQRIATPSMAGQSPGVPGFVFCRAVDSNAGSGAILLPFSGQFCFFVTMEPAGSMAVVGGRQRWRISMSIGLILLIILIIILLGGFRGGGRFYGTGYYGGGGLGLIIIIILILLLMGRI
jgi:uncharacterized protein DUF3309